MTIIEAIIEVTKTHNVEAVIITDDMHRDIKHGMLTEGNVIQALQEIEKVNGKYHGISIATEFFSGGCFQITMTINKDFNKYDLTAALVAVGDYSGFTHDNHTGYIVELDIYDELTVAGNYGSYYDYSLHAIVFDRILS